MNPLLVNIKIGRQQHILLLLLSFLVSWNKVLIAQEIFVSGEGWVLANDLMKTKAQFENEALMIARENAIEKAFGSSVMSNYERLSETEMLGRSVGFHIERRSNYLNTFPNGIWLRDESKNCSESRDENGNYWYKCQVTGYARQIETAKVSFIAHTLYGTNPTINRKESFYNGERGFLYFRSPENGYIIVFYDDMDKVQRCIPYNYTTDNCFLVENNREYIFFSKERGDYLPDSNVIDEIEYYTEKPIEYNQYYILFSPTPFSGYFYNPPEKLEGGYTTFKYLSSESFHTWLQENRIRNKELQVQILGVTITR